MGFHSTWSQQRGCRDNVKCLSAGRIVGAQSMSIAFCPLPFTLVSPLRGSFETNFLHKDIARAHGVNSQGSRFPLGKSPPLKKAITDLISYHLPFQLARVL